MRSRRRNLLIFRIVVFVVLGGFFLIPIGAMFEFSTRGNSIDSPRTLEAWTNIATTPGLTDAIVASLISATFAS